MLKIVSFKICPFVERVIAALESKGVDYEVAYISLKEKPQWFLDISPNGQVPILITEGDEAIFESEAIIEYIEERYPSEPPTSTPHQRAIERAWGYLAAKNYLVQCSAMRSPTPEKLAERTEKLGAALDKIEVAFGDTPFFAGERVGRVDVAWLPLLHRAAIIAEKTGYDMLGGRPKLKGWQARLLATGLGERAVSPDFVDVFSNFYLSERTFLGRGAHVVDGAYGDGNTMAEIGA